MTVDEVLKTNFRRRKVRTSEPPEPMNSYSYQELVACIFSF